MDAPPAVTPDCALPRARRRPAPAGAQQPRVRAALCAALALIAARPARCDDPPRAAPSASAPAAGLETIDVAGREPRYVAPTARDRIGRIWAPVRLDGRGPFRMVLDTGAGRSAVLARVAEALGKTPHPTRRVLLRGITGQAAVATIPVDSLEIGDLLLDTLELPIVADAFGGADGVLGVDGFDRLRVTIEFRRDRIDIRRSRGEPAPPGFSTLPIAPVAGRGLVVAARVGAVPVRAIIDTGAQSTVGNLALRERLRRQLRAQAATTTGVVGATLDVQEGDLLSVPPIRLGSTEARGVHVTFVDLAIFSHWHYDTEPTILIGMDVLGVLDTLIIDYKRRELQLRGTRMGLLEEP